MQVNYQEDHVTHTVIGGKQTIDFGISNSAEFFQILSSTLYKNQRLAVMRETLCNAWDAHIVTGRTNVPVEVTIANNQIIIKDFGPGILDADMGPIYGVYGASTKQNDGKQTGGFGLGCKAPFAYTDHFQVVSCHKGIKTIYTISKSSSTVGGKPGITPIVSMPTDDTGLTVTIQLREPNDAGVFASYLKKIALNGDIFCTLNGEVLPRLGMPMVANTFAFTTSLDMSQGRIYIRYGNVVYPIERHNEYRDLYDKVNKVAEVISDHRNGMFGIVFQAAPHTISVTPSRESLSMQEHTIKTIISLFKQFLSQYNNKALETSKFKCVDEYYANVKEENINVNAYLSTKLEVRFEFEQTKNTKTLLTIEDYTRAFLVKHYPRDYNFRLYDLNHRIALLIKYKLINEGLAKSFIQFFKQTNEQDFKLYSGESNAYYQRKQGVTVNEWFFKSYMRKLLAKYLSHFPLDRLYVSDKGVASTYNFDYGKTPPFFHRDSVLTQVRAVRFFHINEMLPYLRNIVVLGTSKNILKIRQPSNSVHTGSGFVFHHVGMKKDEIEKARAFWATTGMTVIDLCDERITEPKATTAVRKPKKDGYVMVHSAWVNNRITLFNYHSDGTERIENPQYYVRTKLRRDSLHTLEGFERHPSWFMERFGRIGAIIHTDVQERALKKAGVPDFQEFIVKWFINQILHNERIKESQRYDSKRIMQLGENIHNSKIVSLVLENPGLKKHFKLVRTMTPEDSELMAMLVYVREDFWLSIDQELMLKEMVRWLFSIPLAPECEAFVKAIDDSPVISFLDVDEFQTRYNETEDPAVHDQLVQLFLTFLKL